MLWEKATPIWRKWQSWGRTLRGSGWGGSGWDPAEPVGLGPGVEEGGRPGGRVRGGALTSWSLQMARSATLPQLTRTTSKQRSGSQP